MSVWHTFHTWILNQQEARLRRRLIKKCDSRALRHLLAFTVKHNRQFPIHDTRLRNALFAVHSWQTEDSYQAYLFASVESYLFQHVQQSSAHEWQVWLRESQRLQHPISAGDPSTAKAIWEAYTTGKLIGLQSPTNNDNYPYKYLADNYWRTYPQVPHQLGSVELWEALPIILEYAASAQYLQPSEYAQWVLDRREKILRDRFIEKASLSTLEDLLDSVANYDRPFPVDQPSVRKSLFSLKSWQIGEQYQERLFLCVEGYLFDNIQQSHADEWKIWLSASRQVGRQIKVMNPVSAEALLEAYNAGKLINLPQEDYDYLLHCYRREYGEILERAEPTAERQALPVLLELATIAQLIGPDESYHSILERWAQQRPHRPRSLRNMNDEQAYHAPRCSVGSPHRVSITICRDPASNAPVRITCTGTTGDATLNTHIFTDLFAAALACDNEPTFLMPNGCVLSLQRQLSNSADPASEPLLSAVIGPGGPVQPTTRTPTLGMDLQDAMLLLTGTFEYYQEVTGLVQVQDFEDWQKDRADELERRIRAKLLVCDGGSYDIDISDIRPKEAGVIHAIPLLHRDNNGAVVPIEIEIPYHLLGAAKVFDLLHNARLGYIEQLITAGRLRQVFAERTYEEQNKQVERWQSFTSQEKQRAIQQQPFVTITYEVNFDLGITKKYEVPQQQDRLDYEEVTRPQLRDSARQSARKYAALIEKLRTLNMPGGLADILTFKLLLDAMLREASLPIAHAGFQKQYKEWVEISTIPIWAAIHEWAVKRGLSADTLAADNILFNARLQVDTQSVVIQPWVMVDLHDSVIRIDGEKGLMEVLRGSQTITLADTLVPDSNHDIHSLKSLHDTFCMWTREAFSREDKYAALRSEISSNYRFYAVVQLERAKQLLFNGNVTQAINIFDDIRRYDLAPIYFWGAVAQQGQLVKAEPAKFYQDPRLREAERARSTQIHMGNRAQPCNYIH